MTKSRKSTAALVGQFIGKVIGFAFTIWLVHYSLVHWGSAWTVAMIASMVLGSLANIRDAIHSDD